MVNNRNQLKVNSEVHSINTRNNSNIFQHWIHLTLYIYIHIQIKFKILHYYQRGPYNLDIKVYNSLPFQIKDLSDNIKSALKAFLHLHSFYTLDEYLN